ncbi:MAG: glycosyl transferase [Armatimonadota bacterium]|nr:MAG: glycosyl transferase [Armatimonadota bacterium]
MPLVSVVLTSYNHAPYLPQAIESVLGQTLRDIEIVAIDDASTDDSPQILQRYADRVRVVLHESNRGTYASLNEGIALSRAPYIAILNSDDMWLPDKLQKQVQVIESEPRIGLVHTGFQVIDAQGNPIGGNPLGIRFHPNPQGDLLPELLARNLFITSSVMFRRDCVQRCGAFEVHLFGMGDWDLWLRIAEHYLVGYVPEPLTLYRLHGQNTMYQSARMLEDDLWIHEERIRKRIPELLQHDGWRMRHAIGIALAALGVIYNRMGRRDRARKAFWQSLRYCPWRLKTWLRLLLVLRHT